MTSALLLSITGAWVATSFVALWFVHRAVRVLRPDNPDRAPRHEALYVPTDWLVEL